MRILKFGGTSMGDAAAISQVADIVEGMPDARVVVVSATSGTTDRLIDLAETAVSGGDWEAIFDELMAKHERIVEDLGLNGITVDGERGNNEARSQTDKITGAGERNANDAASQGGEATGERLDLQAFFENLRKVVTGISMITELSLSARDRVLTFGERISSCILAALLRKRGVRAEAVDAYEVIFADNNFGEGNVCFERTDKAVRERLQPMLDDGCVPVITGFVAQAENGLYITLGRGGSDYTAAILAAALEASELQIWTDVDGIFNTDPRLVSQASVLPCLSFNEAGELAYFGAKVLHPKTIKPAIRKSIPVKILNTFNPGAPGTLITNDEEESVKSVTYRKGVSIINVCSAGMLEAPGFLGRLFEIFARRGISVDVVSTSEVSVSLTVDNGHADEVLSELEEFARVSVQTGMAIVCLVGEGIRSNRGILGQLFSALDAHNVSMVSQGASKRNITFLVAEDEAAEVVKKVFGKFFNKKL